MQARSYLENIANRTMMRDVIAAMTRMLLVVVLVGATALVVLTGFHPAALIAGVVLLVLAGVLVRDVVLVTRDLRAHPLDLAFDPAPSKGLITPGTVFGVAGGLALFGGVMAVVTFLMGGEVSFWAWALLAVALAMALIGIPTLGVQRRKWPLLSRILGEHPELSDFLRDARRRFPQDAPFPFEAPTDGVQIS